MDDVTDQLLTRVAELETEYSALSELHEKATERTVQLTEKVAELDVWQKERVEEESALVKAYGDAIRSRHELAAVIEEAKAATKRGNVLTPDWVTEVLETADTAAVLAEHDREVAAKAWDEGENASRMFYQNAYDASIALPEVMASLPHNPYHATEDPDKHDGHEFCDPRLGCVEGAQDPT